LVRAAQEFKWFEQGGMQHGVLPLRILEYHGEQFALLGLGPGAERVASVARQANDVDAVVSGGNSAIRVAVSLRSRSAICSSMALLFSSTTSSQRQLGA